ncbi:MAG: hypothetical protein E7812_02985 [Phenylobacterium sp.]|nr:MAG: hypothetical protein E7812_02985 [Phenylobacterium sp.]
MHAGEEELRAKSLELIQADRDLAHHAKIIEQGQDLLHVLIHSTPHRDDDDLTVRMLGIRLFNAVASATKLMLSGYYQNAAFQLRDILETVFLLDYLRDDRSRIATWRASDKKQRTTMFGPAAIRRALDKRDGFTSGKRDADYSFLCELAAHPTQMGFQMLKVDDENVHCGPFLLPKALKGVLSETAKLQVQAAGQFMGFFDWDESEASELRIDFIEAQGRWLGRFWGAADNSKLVAAMRADLARRRG